MLFVSFCKKPFTFILVFCKIRKAEGRCCGKVWADMCDRQENIQLENFNPTFLFTWKGKRDQDEKGIIATTFWKSHL
mgnify:CR=1 FL=1